MGIANFEKKKGVKKKNKKKDNEGNFNDGPDLTADGNFVAFQSDADIDGTEQPDVPEGDSDIFIQGPNLEIIRITSSDAGSGDEEFVIESAFSPSVVGDEDKLHVAFARGEGAELQFFVETIEDPLEDAARSERVIVGTSGNLGDIEAQSAPNSLINLSTNARFAAFISDRPLVQSLHPGAPNDPNAAPDVYVQDLRNLDQGPILVSLDNSGTAGGGVAFRSMEIFFERMQLSGFAENGVSISGDGRAVVYSTSAPLSELDNDGDEFDVYLSVLSEDGSPVELIFVSEDIDGPALQPDISADGRFVVFTTDQGVVRWRVRDEQSQEVDGSSAGYDPSISHNGRLVAFTSEEPLVRGDTNEVTDIFVWDFAERVMTRVSVDEFGDQLDPNVTAGFEDLFGAFAPALSDDGGTVAFVSSSPTLLASADFPRGRLNSFTETDPLGLVDTVFRGDVVFEDLRVVAGTDRSERLLGTRKEELIDALDGHDRVFARVGDDRVFGGSGRDRADGQGGADLLDGGSDDDVLRGLNGLDRLKGRDGNDRLHGHKGPDRLDGGPGDDHLFGNDGQDRLEGGSGNDTLNSGSGRDTIIYDRFSFSNVPPAFSPSSGGEPALTIGEDEIHFFKRGKDVIQFLNFDFSNGDGLASFDDLLIRGRLVEENGNTVIKLDDLFNIGPNTITVIGITGLTADDFEFN